MRPKDVSRQCISLDVHKNVINYIYRQLTRYFFGVLNSYIKNKNLIIVLRTRSIADLEKV